jgi:hypothetical protein
VKTTSAIAGMILVLLCASPSHAQIPAGRWQVVTVTGDQAAQVKSGVPVMFDTTFLCVGGACGALDSYTRDTSICDQVNYANVSSGMSVDAASNMSALEFEVSGGGGGVFIYEFVGSLTETYTETDGVTSLNGARITGQYGSTPGGCNNGTAMAQGSFVAHWYPPLTATLLGEIVPTEKVGTSMGMELKLMQAQNGDLSGEIVTGTLVSEPRSGILFIEPAKNRCFTSSILQVVSGPALFPSAAAGHLFHLYAIDTVGNSLALNGSARTVGSNDQYWVAYEITGGPCDGQNGTHASFRVLATLRGDAPPRPRDPRRSTIGN